MKKTRKFISIFAILFAIVLAFSVCFFAACKGGSDDGGNSDDTGVVDPTPDPTPEPDPDPDPDPTPSNEYTITKDMVVAVPVAVTYNGASFQNESDFAVTGTENSDGTVSFAASGTAATMDETQATAFGANAQADDAYVVIGIYSNLGDVISWTTSLGEEKSWEKTEERAQNDDDLAIIERISAESTAFTFTITSTAGKTATVSVSLTAVTIPGEAVELEEVASWDFSDTTRFGSSSIDTTTPTADTENVGTTTITETTDGQTTEKTVYYIATEVKYTDGTSTGLTCMQSSEKRTKIDGSNQRVNFGGGIFTYQSCLIYSLDAGTYTITMSYYSGSNGRYATIINSEGTRLIDNASSEYQTTEDNAVVTRTVTLTLAEAGDIYFGSASSGLYLTGITICK